MTSPTTQPATAPSPALRFDDLRAIDVFAAAQRLRGIARRTTLQHSPRLSAHVGREVYLKLECEQVTGSFKVRGAFNAIASLDETTRARGVITSSAGNHGLGTAFAARHFGIAATIYVPRTAPQVKRRGIEQLGATVNAEEPDYDAAFARARRAAAEQGKTFIHPCLGRTLIAGQGTVALEIIEDLPAVQCVVVPVGGAGLLAGFGSLLRAVAPEVRIVGAQSVHTAAMARSLEAQRVVSIASVATLADGLAGDIDEFALEVGRRSLDEMALVSEAEIGRAIAWLAANEGLVVEGSGAVSVAALLAHRVGSTGSPLVAVISGKNIDPDVHARVLAEAA